MAAALTTAPNFDRVARIYRWAEYLALGPLLTLVRNHFLPALHSRRRALVLGDGDGRFLARLLRRNPTLRAHAVDGSLAMLHLLRRRCSFAADRLTSEHTVLPACNPPWPPDLVVSHFLLDCFSAPDLSRLVARISAIASPEALWLISDFGLPRQPALKLFAKGYIRALYLAFRLLTGLRAQHLPEHDAPLAQHGWERTHRRDWLGGFLYTELWQRAVFPTTSDATPRPLGTSTSL